MKRAGVILFLTLGLAVLLGGRAWISHMLGDVPLYRYSFEWFLKLGPSEGSFYWRYLLSGTAAALLVALGLFPLIRTLGPRWRGTVPRWGVPALATTAMALVAILGFGLLDDQVVTDDEYAYQFQSRIALTGHASVPAPELPEFLRNVFVISRDGRWFGQYPPGHPLVLALGVLVGLPRLIPILLAGVNVFLTALLLRRLVGPGWALFGTALLAFSPLFLLTGATLLSHPTSYLGLVLSLLGAVRVAQRDSAGWGVVCGIGIGLLFLARPWTGVTLGLFPVAVLVWCFAALRSRRAIFGALAPLVFSGAFFLAYNWGVSGDPTLTGYQAVRGPDMGEFGFGTIFPGVYDHTPLQGVKNALQLAVRLHFWSLGWPLALVFAGLGLVSIRTPGPQKTSGLPAHAVAGGALAMILVGLASYIPYWSLGVADTGPVKTYELLLPLAVLSTLGARWWAERRGGASLASWMGGSIVTALVVFWPIQLAHVSGVAAHVAKPVRVVESKVEPPALVFVSNMQPRPARTWVFGRPNPRPDLSDPILYVRDLGPKNMNYWRIHPGRRAYRLVYEDTEPKIVPMTSRTPRR
jgi:hypothetical protein